MSADIIIENAAILTMDEMCPRADALAISGNRIAAIGSNRDVAGEKGNLTRVIDAEGATVTPGFIESHMHLFAGAAELGHLQLFGCRGFDELKDRTAAFLRNNPGKDLVIGEQADYVIISESESLTRHHLDRIEKHRPLLLFAPDHHTAWANTLALERAGILRGKTVGAGNEVVMGSDGLATGELREGEAIDPVRRLSTESGRERFGLVTGGEPEPYPDASGFEDDLATIAKGLAHVAAHGLTSIHNMDGNIYTLELLDELRRRGQLTARVRVPFHMKNFMELSMLDKASMMSDRYRSDMLQSGFVKVFLDGVVDSATAVMVEDYADRPGWRGDPLFKRDHFAQVAKEADRRGLQIAVHAIGDGAVRIALDGFEKALKANGRRDSRHRIEHVEVIHADDIARFAELGAIASMQPPHPPGCHGLPLEPYLSRLGKARWPFAFAQRAIRNTGAHVVFATDWPVSDIDPLWSIQSAMTRGLWSAGLPDNRVSLHEAIYSYTVEGAYAGFMDGKTGILKPGFLADVTVLGGNLEKTDPEAIRTVRPRVTICDGQVVFGG